MEALSGQGAPEHGQRGGAERRSPQRRGAVVWPGPVLIAAIAVILIEVVAFLVDLDGEPLALGEGWVVTRPAGVAAWVLLAAACLPLLALTRRPVAAALASAAAYGAYITADHAFGLTLPPMLAILVLAARRDRVAAWLVAALSLMATLVWVHRRAVGVVDPEVGMLVWVAFGSVSAIFFLGSALVGELIAARNGGRATGSARTLSSSGGPSRPGRG